MTSKDYIALMQKILHYIEDGVHVIDKDGNTIIYNRAMEELEGMKKEDVLNRPLLDVFKSLDNETSTLLKVLKSGTPIKNKKQVYLNINGKEITTINTTVPLSLNGEKFGALEIAKDITKIKKLSDIILDLQNEISNGQTTKQLKIKKYTFDNILGESKAFKDALSIAKKAAKNSAPVLIYGETGTGKELFAQSIHYASNRANNPFIAQNCAAIPETLLEGILFGTSKGAFTGAIDRAGIFEQANGGTILLDEINSMPIQLQAKLLRVLQEGYIRRIGGSKDIPIDVRVIATTNENPIEAVEKDKIRKDLYYRLNVISINIPALRDRKEDIIPLSSHFIKKYNNILKKDIWIISEKSKEILLEHSWPGNVRELENTIYAAVSMTDDDHVLNHQSLNILNLNKRINKEKIDIDINNNLDETMKTIEVKFIKKALFENNNNITKAANDLGIKRQTLQHKMKKYGIR
ncbi:arginine utilization regulatory protein [Alkalithermobacter thermoalcaliphilus JW-YL-7 = DSM 7308]|uniref:Arginine utilization regulatory protein n=1 Tax=Alkalithermobacter thermoalcaliphilus JW-YL-7 = DSM 7308 TaxID=1121328 RepID=A0A150FP75_CLOPD|nr:PAS modulated sigma54 specific transcriptional regulator, Fis family [[Clostridium] paradoxum JW-YL-7 = DSM 7308]SHK51448.1 arginine utilization regulatory protein [[Clostridium] paradoxum JW-YL-7 = DSM 7308]